MKIMIKLNKTELLWIAICILFPFELIHGDSNGVQFQCFLLLFGGGSMVEWLGRRT